LTVTMPREEGLIITSTTPGIPKTQVFRGYPDNFQTGDRLAKTVLSYRFPIFDLSKGFESFLPVYLRQLFGEVYYEGGRTWGDTGYGNDLGWINSLGVECNFALTICA